MYTCGVGPVKCLREYVGKAGNGIRHGKAIVMNALKSHSPADIRVWIVASQAWEPATPFDEPPASRPLFPGVERPLTRAEARAFVAGFNAEMLACGGRRWAVARKATTSTDEIDTPAVSLSSVDNPDSRDGEGATTHRQAAER